VAFGSGASSDALNHPGTQRSRRGLGRHFVGVGLSIVLAQGAILPAAQAEGSDTDRTQAQLLFNQGRDLMSAGKYSEACAKFAESQRLDPGGGTLLNLALCHEKQGKTATAWADFNEALSAALRDRRPEREKLARDHIAALEPQLSRLIVQTDRATSDAGLAVKIDGRDVSRSAWGTPVPVDPREHDVEAVAPGKEPWTKHVVLRGAETLTVTVPELRALSDSPTLSTATPSSGRDASSSSRSRTVGYLTAGFGLVALGVGTTYGLSAINEQKLADPLCPADRCSQPGLDHNRVAVRDAWISDGFFAVGLVAAALGTYWILDPGQKPAPLSSSTRPPLAPSVAFDVKPSARGTDAAVIVRGKW